MLAVDGHRHLVSQFVYPLPEAVQHKLTRHFGGIGRLRLDLGDMAGRGDGRLARGFVNEIINLSQCKQAFEYMVAALGGARRVGDWVVPGRRFGQAGQHGDFGNAQAFKFDPVIHLRGRGESVGAVAEKNLVEIQLQNFILGQGALYVEGEQHLFQFAGVGSLRREEKISRHLHGNGARPLRAGFAAQVAHHGAQDSGKIDAGVVIEAVVFGDQHGVNQQRRGVVQGYRYAPFVAVFGDESVVAVVNAQGYVQGNPPNFLDGGQPGQQGEGVYPQPDAHGGRQQQPPADEFEQQFQEQFYRAGWLGLLFCGSFCGLFCVAGECAGKFPPAHGSGVIITATRIGYEDQY